jgi:hypothetical protein
MPETWIMQIWHYKVQKSSTLLQMAKWEIPLLFKRPSYLLFLMFDKELFIRIQKNIKKKSMPA